MGRANQEGSAGESVVYVGLELGLQKWVVCVSDGRREKVRVIERGGVEALRNECRRICAAWAMRPREIRTVQEAGPLGFSVHRELEEAGFVSIVVDAASIEVSRRRRRAKTDRLDAAALVRLLQRHYHGERRALHVVNVPTVEQEDERRPLREIHRLKRERTAASNRIKGLLLQIGLASVKVNGLLPRALEEMARSGMLPPNLRRDVLHTFARWQLIDRQLKDIRNSLNRRVHAVARADAKTKPSRDAVARMVSKLMRLSGIGAGCAWLLVVELFGWRHFRNRRELAGAVGLTPTPWASSTIEREQGISKAGNPRVRWMMQEIALCWLRFQPTSGLSLWFAQHFARGRRDHHRGVTALARRLLIALWRYLEKDVVPEGARMKAAA